MLKLFLGFLFGVIMMIPGFSAADPSGEVSYSILVNDNATGVRSRMVDGQHYVSVEDVSLLFGFDYYINENDGRINLISKSGKPAGRPQIHTETITVSPSP